MKDIGIRKAITVFGGTEIEVHKGYHYQYGFFVKGGQLYYFNTGDDRMEKYGQLDVYYRTAEHRQDWRGGTNCFDLLSFLNKRGYRLTKHPSTRERM